jgi:transcriptional regulator with XRE-family HTH domain
MFDPKILNNLILKSGMTPTEVAREAKLSHTALANILKHGSDPKVGTLEALARVLRVSVSHLLGEEKATKRPPSYIITVPEAMRTEGEIEVILKFV